MMKTFLGPLTKHSWIYILIPALVLAITGDFIPTPHPNSQTAPLCLVFFRDSDVITHTMPPLARSLLPPSVEK